jgi:hypothetical protein
VKRICGGVEIVSGRAELAGNLGEKWLGGGVIAGVQASFPRPPAQWPWQAR